MRRTVFTAFVVLSLAAFGACDSQSSSTDTCGDNIVDPGEACDGIDLGGQSCPQLGFYGGDLSCNPDCTLDLGPCQATGWCGDGVLQAGEDCEGGIGEVTCASLGQNFTGGTLSCGADCRYDTSRCESIGYCGDGNWQSAIGESCDGTDLAGLTCEAFDLRGPGLACLEDCSDFDLTACQANGLCGDGAIQTAMGEVCDGTNLGGNECSDLGYYGTGLACAGDCLSFDLSVCAVNGICGDGEIQTGFGETCDGTDLDGKSCVNLGYYGPGQVICDGECHLDISGCERCGDGIIQSGEGEECEGADIGGALCADRYLTTGTVGCTDCELDYSGCSGYAFTFISLGDNHVCSLNRDGQALCWGDHSYGQVGISTTSSDVLDPSYVLSYTHALFTDAVFTQVSAGALHTCALDDTGDGWCWGYMLRGRLGNGIAMDLGCNAPEPVLMPVGAQFSHIEAGGAHSCALDTTGAAWCWGSNEQGQLGTDATNLTVDTPRAAVMPQGVTFETLSAGGAHTCAVDSAGAAWCWGANTYGQIGDGTTVGTLVPTEVSMPPAVAFTAITSGQDFTCALDDAGAAWCWGNNPDGRLGDGTTVSSSVPVQVSLPGGVLLTALSAGSAHVCSVDTTGVAWCWGDNALGQLGQGDTTARSTPAQVAVSGVQFATITAGMRSTCALAADGAVLCWGTNGDGQLGDLTTTDRFTPALVVDP